MTTQQPTITPAQVSKETLQQIIAKLKESKGK